jgi:futalosine hydrolase
LNILVCVATDFEGAALRRPFGDTVRVRVVETGVGPVNAAHAATVAILKERPDAILVCGVGGVYPSSDVRIGEVVSAAAEVYGDLGAQSPSGFLDMQALGFPVVNTPTTLFNELPMQVFPTPRQVRFVTVSTCTGTDATAREIEARTKGVVENMEGAAVAHIAHIYEIAVGEVRGISNIVTNRDTKTWRLREAAGAAQEAVVNWINRLER